MGFKLHVVANRQGQIVAFDLSKANRHDLDPVKMSNIQFNIQSGYGLVFKDSAFIGIAIVVVSQKPTAKRSLYCGLMLVILGLAASLYVHFFHSSNAAVPSQLQSFLSSFSWITAGIGGDLAAASAVMENQAKDAVVSGLATTVSCPLRNQ